MIGRARDIVTAAARDCLRSWRSLALTDLAFKTIAFALLSPAATLLLRALMARAAGDVVADVDIARFLLATPLGVLTLIAALAIALGILSLQATCLTAIGLAAAKGTTLHVRQALAFAARRAPRVLRLTANMAVRLLIGLLPFLAALGLIFALLLRRFDINYYLAERPPEAWVALALAAPVVVGLVALLVRTIRRWALALPITLFEDLSPERALGESARRSLPARGLILTVLALWAVAALALLGATTALIEFAGRSLAPSFSGSLGMLLLFVASLAAVWAAIGYVVGIVNFSMFAALIVRLYLRVGEPPLSLTVQSMVTRERPSWLPRRVTGGAVAGLAAVAFLAGLGFAVLSLLTTRTLRPVAIIAHRGASAEAPENTLAAFRLAVEEGTDLIELDVQESRDGEIVVVHDRDLMKIGGAAMNIWETDAARLRTVDIGSHKDPRFASERVPTLAEALDIARGRSRMLVELKSYGHAERLEERVAAVVEQAGMQGDCIFMSLDHDLVRRMTAVRPGWRTGVLTAKALGDLTRLDADFLAVEAKIATARFVRRAHRAGKDVYVWTVNDPAQMLRAMSRGVDGLITDRPGLARQVVERRAAMSDAERLLAALLIRLGAGTDTLDAVTDARN